MLKERNRSRKRRELAILRMGMDGGKPVMVASRSVHYDPNKKRNNVIARTRKQPQSTDSLVTAILKHFGGLKIS
jgi:hypothetical protein